jgi:transcriptional regulator with GAF, ATPase, and Fis domain
MVCETDLWFMIFKPFRDIAIRVLTFSYGKGRDFLEKQIFELELKTLYAISRKIGQVLDLDKTLRSILKILSRNLSMERGTVTLKDRETGLLRIIASYGLDAME